MLLLLYRHSKDCQRRSNHSVSHSSQACRRLLTKQCCNAQQYTPSQSVARMHAGNRVQCSAA
jgi:hypothetical protein